MSMCSKDNECKDEKSGGKKNCKHHQNLERDRKLDHNKENEQTSSYNCHKEDELLHKAWANYNRENERYNAKMI